MSTRNAIASVLVASILVTGCANPSSDRYEASDVGRTIETTTGSVVSSRVVKISGDNGQIGAVAGGALGGAGAGWGFQSGWAAIIGAVIGAGVGYAAQHVANDREGIEYVLHMEDGRTITLVQNRESSEPPIANGTPVLVQISGKYTRVTPDPRGDQRKGAGGWVDPDSIGGSGASGAPGAYPATAPAVTTGSATSPSGSGSAGTASGSDAPPPPSQQ